MPAGGLLLSVILFLSCSACGFLILILRRVFLKGELGGANGTRYGSCFVFICLWLIYVIFAGLGTYEVIDLDKYIKGEDGSKSVVDAAKNLFEATKRIIEKGSQ